MRVLLISDYLVNFHKTWSGAEQVCDALAKSLAKEKQEIFYLCTKAGNKKQDKVFQVPILVAGRNIFKKMLLPLYIVWASLYVFYYLKKVKPDIINFLHCNYLFIPTMIANKLFNIPTVFTFLDYYLLCPQANFKKGDNKICNNPAICSGCAPFMKIMESRMSRNLAKKITGFITLTETSKKRLVSFGFKPDKIKVIYTYSIPKEFADKKADFRPNSVLFIGSFHEHKGLRVVLYAMEQVLMEVPKAILKVVGSGSSQDQNEIKALVKTLKMEDRVVFLGQKNSEEVLNLILQNALVVVAEQWPSEFGPLVLVETLALGRPLVSGNLGSPPDFIKEGQNGFLAAYNNPDEYAKKMIQVLNNPLLAQKMGENARATGRFLFDQSYGRETLKFYQLLNQKT